MIADEKLDVNVYLESQDFNKPQRDQPRNSAQEDIILNENIT